MKSVLISIRPKWCELIASGKKTIEVRKTYPKLPRPFKCYIYCTKDARNADKLLVPTEYHFRGYGKIIGEFVCDYIDMAQWEHITGYAGWNIGWTEKSCLTNDELATYAGKNDIIYGWHISDLKIYDNPRELSDFGKARPPQSWCYVDAE